MTDAPLHLTLAASSEQIFDVAAHLSAQAQGRGWRRWGMVPAAAAGPLIAGVLAGVMSVPVNPVLFGALIGTGAMMTGQILLSRDATRHFRRLLSGSAFFPPSQPGHPVARRPDAGGPHLALGRDNRHQPPGRPDHAAILGCRRRHHP